MQVVRSPEDQAFHPQAHHGVEIKPPDFGYASGSHDSDKRAADLLLAAGGFSCDTSSSEFGLLHDTKAFFRSFLRWNFSPGFAAAAVKLYGTNLDDERAVANLLLSELPLTLSLAELVAKRIRTHRAHLLDVVVRAAVGNVRAEIEKIACAKAAACERAVERGTAGDASARPSGNSGGWQVQRRRRRGPPPLVFGDLFNLRSVRDAKGHEFLVARDEAELAKAVSALRGVAFHGCTLFSAKSISRGIDPPVAPGEFLSEGAFYVTDSPVFAAHRAMDKGEITSLDVEKLTWRQQPDTPCIVVFGAVDVGHLVAKTLTEGLMYRQFVYANISQNYDLSSYPESWHDADIITGPICRSTDVEVVRNYTDVKCFLSGSQAAYVTAPAIRAIYKAITPTPILLASDFAIPRPT